MYLQHFASSWLLLPELKRWLQRVKQDDTKPMCIACNKLLTAGKSELQRHTEIAAHKKTFPQKITHSLQVICFKIFNNTTIKNVNCLSLRFFEKLRTSDGSYDAVCVNGDK